MVKLQRIGQQRNLKTSASASKFLNRSSVGDVHSPNVRGRTALDSRLSRKSSKEFVPCRQVQVLSMDTSSTPTFMLTSQKSLSALPHPAWSVVGPNLRYISYKDSYPFLKQKKIRRFDEGGAAYMVPEVVIPPTANPRTATTTFPRPESMEPKEVNFFLTATGNFRDPISRGLEKQPPSFSSTTKPVWMHP